MDSGSSSIVLYGSRLSPFVEKVARALQLKQLPFRGVDLSTPFDLARWNPTTRKMPVLEVDGRKDYDSSFLLRWIDTLRDSPPLWSSDRPTMLRQRFLEDWSDESLYFYVFSLRWSPGNSAATAAQLAATVPRFLRPLAGFAFARRIKPMTIAQGLGRLPVDRLLAELDRRLEELELLLADSPFFFANVPGAADLAIFGQMSTLRSGPTADGAALFSSRPSLVAWYERVDAATGSAT